MNRIARVLAALLALLALPVLQAQETSTWMVGIGAGSTEWVDGRELVGLTRRGGAPRTTAVVIRGSRNLLGRVTGFEWGGAFASYKEEARLNPTHLFGLDGRLVLQTPWTLVQPFAGAGPSLVWYMNNAGGRSAMELAYNVGGGVRVRVQPGLYLIGDVRMRAWNLDGFGYDDSSGEITLSLGFRP